MKHFDDTELLEILNTCDNAKATPLATLNGILKEFLEEIHSYCREDRDIAERIRSLNYLKSKLTTYLEDKALTSKKFTVLRIIIKQAISSIDAELLIVKMDLQYPERFIEFPSDNPPLGRWNGEIIELIEYFSPLQIKGRIQKPSGEPMLFSDMVVMLEAFFGIVIVKPHDVRARILARKKNPTQFIDEMRVALREASGKP